MSRAIISLVLLLAAVLDLVWLVRTVELLSQIFAAAGAVVFTVSIALLNIPDQTNNG